MRFYKLFLSASLLSVACASMSQSNTDMDWLDKSMKKAESLQEKPEFKSILEQFAPEAVEKQIAPYTQQANDISQQSFKALPDALVKYTGVDQKDAATFTGRYDKETPESSDSLSAIFVSFSLSDRQIKQAFEEAESHGAEIYFNGLHPDDKTITDTMRRLRDVMKGSDVWIPARFHPKAFREFNVTQVPVLMHATANNVATVSGLLNLSWLKDQMRFTEGLTNLGKRAPTKPVIERDFIEEITARMRGLDMKSKQSAAVENFWKKQALVTIADAKEDKTFYIDPTVRVQKDIINPNGDVLARKGDVINPLQSAPTQSTYILFNATKPHHVEWAFNQMNKVGSLGKVMVMTSQMDKEDGWEHLSALRKKMQREVYMIPKQLVERFAITGLPAIVSTDLDKYLLKIQQYSLSEEGN
jgi:conjugal transfer pilus assembly protein TraW